VAKTFGEVQRLGLGEVSMGLAKKGYVSSKKYQGTPKQFGGF